MTQPGAYIEAGSAQHQMDQVHQGLQDARKLHQQMQEAVEHMVRGPWQGPLAQGFHRQFQEHADDFGTIVQQLEHIVEIGQQNQNEFVNSEQ